MSVHKEIIHEIILEKLLESPGTFVSGEAISERLGFTRAALWKHMQTLQLEQWPIESVSRKGYRIIKGFKYPFSKVGIIQSLREISNGKTNKGFWDISVYETVESTSNQIKELAFQSKEGTVVFAKKQTGGRGRIGKKWSSKENMGLWMSVLLKPDMPASQVQAITLAAAVAITSTVYQTLKEDCKIDDPARSELLESFGIKWPNDILWNGRKICGILTELAAEPEKLHYVVLGVGLNVFHKETDFPEELRKTAASLEMMVQKTKIHSQIIDCTVSKGAILPESAPEVDELDMNRIAGRILFNIELVYQEFLLNGMANIVKQWREYSITIGRKILVIGDETFEAKAIDVLENGQLIVEDDKGNLIELLSGEISIRPIAESQVSDF